MEQYLGALLQKPAFVIPLTIWSLSLKGLALWRAAKNEQKYWFVALLVVNTVGILEIIYLTWFSQKERFWDKIIQRFTKK